MQDWIAATASRRGAHHEHAGRPNEDHARADLDTTPAVVTVADGHGAPQYTRADRGSQLATQAAVEVLRSHHDDLDGLPKALVERWRELVAADVEEQPPPREEVGRGEPHELYGTTLLAAADLGDRLLLVQLGDGDTILARCGGEHGEVRRPIPPVQYAFPNATDSLVQPDAADVVRLAQVDHDEFGADLLLLATDGLDAARPGRSWHTAAARELCDQVRGLAAGALDEVVDTWCADAAEAGGDDTTMALLASTRVLGGTPGS